MIVQRLTQVKAPPTVAPTPADDAVPRPRSSRPSCRRRETCRSTQARKKVYPQSVSGRFRTHQVGDAGRSASASTTSCRSLRWDRGPNAPNQAVLVDLANGRFYFFFIEIWPQEVYYLTGLLILAAHRRCS